MPVLSFTSSPARGVRKLELEYSKAAKVMGLDKEVQSTSRWLVGDDSWDATNGGFTKRFAQYRTGRYVAVRRILNDKTVYYDRFTSPIASQRLMTATHCQRNL